MKHLTTFLLFASLAFGASAPRIVTLSGSVHPKAEIVSVDAGKGIAVFRFLNASGNPVDSGGSIARFAPLSPNQKEKPSDPDTFPEVPDSTLSEAITNPPPSPPSVVVLTPLALISRMTDAEKVAVFTSADPDVIVWRNMAVAALDIRSDDPRTKAGFDLLVAKGVLVANRPAELLAP